jgi:hypothetical protein
MEISLIPDSLRNIGSETMTVSLEISEGMEIVRTAMSRLLTGNTAPEGIQGQGSSPDQHGTPKVRCP